LSRALHRNQSNESKKPESDPTPHFELAGSFHINVSGIRAGWRRNRDVEVE